jgi:two-component system osmolarity sensor histidine kinase EnvZ
MRARIQRHIEQRTQLLAGVSHDLRTPLTRLKLQLALMPASQDVAEAKADLDVMESMLDEYLAFARGQWVEEPEAADLGAIAQTAVDDARRAGASIEFAAQGELGAVVRPGAIRRVVGNLIDNAIGHGQAVRVLAVRRGRSILIEVEDDGPGIPPDKIEDAFKPFVRLDAARSQNRKGVGLGLAIARDLARSHGGDLTLDRSSLGGLRATLRLPAGAA